MKLLFAASMALGLSAWPASAEGWACSAPGLVSGTYDGGEAAYIHLNGFSDGKFYLVKKSGSRATGTTSNGTTFVCTKK